MSKPVREPIQVYLTSDERVALDRAAKELGVSRSEVLRRGVEVVGGARVAGPLRDLATGGLVTPATAGPGDPPPSRPVAPLDELLRELSADRADR